jgi:DNA-binding NarL/FixJ family response regulator
MLNAVSTFKSETSRVGVSDRIALELHRTAASDIEEPQCQTMASLKGVDRRTREIYVAHRSGATYAEIAARWRISNRAIKRHVAQALLALMESMELNHNESS